MWFKDKRVGKFEIDAEVIDEHSDAVKAILGSCIVVGAEMMIQKRAIVYHAICDKFEEVEQGFYPPTYDMELNESEDGGYEVVWTKQT